ncbi:MAG: phosphoglycerate kinase [Lentisphaerae bacterium]|nr:phosphoglycerate kinase [Lentisphaerota bacterium]
MNKKTVRDVDFGGKRVLMRVDFNVPMKNGAVADDTRIRAALPTIRYVLERGAGSLVLMSHLGDPRKDAGKAREKAEKAGKPFDEKAYIEAKHRMAPVVACFAGHLGREVKLAPACLGPETERMVAALPAGGVLMLENTRFHKEETSADAAERDRMARALAAYGDVFVNDAFGSAHRDHASTASVGKFFRENVAGFLMEKEIDYLSRALENPDRPYAAVLGGAKIGDKLKVVENLLTKVDTLIVGGGMAYTFLKAQGHAIGQSLCDAGKIPYAGRMLAEARKRGVNFLLPVDNVAADKFDANAETRAVGVEIPEGWMALDIGPKTTELYAQAIRGARMVVWNGPMGCFEMPKFADGTMGVCRAIAASGAVSIVGGGDSVAAVNKSGLAARFTHISTGGGASLEFLEGKQLPGIAALSPRE